MTDFKRNEEPYKALNIGIQLDYSQIEDVCVEGINTRDYPEFCDAYIASATYKGREMTDEELEVLNDDGEYVYEKVMDWIY